MWLARGIQSAVFYYVACTPCADASYRRKRRTDAERARKLREQTEVDQPHTIHQPVPFQTNQYWDEEIAMGPGPPQKLKREGHGKADSARKGLGSSGQSSSVPGGSPNDSGLSGLSGSTAVLESEESRLAVIKEGIKGAMQETKWNWKRYEREDELLWGPETDRLRSLLKGKGREREGSKPDGPGRARAGTGDSVDSHMYYIARNPEVNDLHPPVVSSLARTKAETRWMLQPPPSAKIMEGKARGGLRSAGGSARKRRDVLSSKKQEDLFSAPETPLGQPHDRDESTDPDIDTLFTPVVHTSPKRKSRPAPISISNDSSSSSPPEQHSKPTHPTSSAALSTITNQEPPLRRPPLATLISTPTNPSSPAFNSRSSSPFSTSRNPHDQNADPHTDSDTNTIPGWDSFFPPVNNSKEIRFPTTSTTAKPVDAHAVSDTETNNTMNVKAAKITLPLSIAGGASESTDFATGQVSPKNFVVVKDKPPGWRWSMDI